MLQRLIYLFVVILIATTPLSAQDKKTEEQRKRMEQYKRELNKTKAEVENLQREKKSASKEVAALDREMRLRNNYIGEVNEERSVVEKTIEGYTSTIDSLEMVLEHNREVYAEAIRVAYRNYVQQNNTNYILASRSITEAARRNAEIEHITESRKALADTILAQTEYLNEQRSLLEQRNHELDSISEVLTLEKRKLEDSRTAAQRAYNKLSKREKEAINEQRKQQKQYDEAVAELQKMLKGNKVGAGFSRNTKGLNLPVEGGELTEQGFGGTITGKKGDAVKTIYDGIVQEVQYKKTTNKYTVFLGYNEYLVTYTNLGAVSVKRGDVVKKDQKIGTIGSGIDSDDKPYVRIAIYDCETKKPLTVSSFFKKK
jgi:septal ring factor EnvC (AmiA/AmiB activator)